MVLVSLPLTCVIIFISIYSYFKGKFSYWQRRNVPSLPATLPYGNFEDMGSTKHTCEIIDETYTKFKGQSPMAAVYFTIKPIAVALDLDLIKDILITDFEQFSNRPLYYNQQKDPLSVQLLTLESGKWERLRNILKTVFTIDQLKSIFPTVDEISNRFSGVVENEWKKSPIIDMKDLIERYMIDMMTNCVLGVDCNSLKCPETEFRNFANKLFNDPRHSSFVLFLCAAFPKIARFLGIKVYRDDVSSFFTETITHAINFREKNEVHRKDLLDFLLKLKADKNQPEEDKTLTQDEILAELFIFFKAGYQTTSSTICFALHELSQELDEQAKIRDEIQTVLKQNADEISFEAVMEMKYLNQVITETIRMHPPIPRLVRCAKSDYKVRNTELIIEKGTLIFIPTYSILNDPDFYPCPDIFDPSRFDQDKGNRRHSMTFLGFGDGPRNCIGHKLARLMICVSLVNILRNFEVAPSHKTPKGLKYNLKIEQLSLQDNMYFELRKI